MRWEEMPPHDKAAGLALALFSASLLLAYLSADVAAVVQYALGW